MTNAEEQVRNEVASWIDTKVLADVVIEELANEDAEIILVNAKKVWLGFLESSLHDGIRIEVEKIVYA